MLTGDLSNMLPLGATAERRFFRFRWDGRIGLEVLSITGARRSVARRDIADVLEKMTTAAWHSPCTILSSPSRHRFVGPFVGRAHLFHITH
ncbi:MAG: hypothetical protein AUI16_14690 [Alphaproteobacteria bacterium 13_2_20CM_2_64_7]|nr:MAG: hypothetical protein AUI16_14690 [Alphaproteobacteria bacterium 13_2_20CM_2_64_7]